MLRTVTRLPLRRCLHTNTASSSGARVFRNYSTTSRLALGASVTFAAYTTWSLSSDSRRIALDAQPVPGMRSSISTMSTVLIRSQHPKSVRLPQLQLRHFPPQTLLHLQYRQKRYPLTPTHPHQVKKQIKVHRMRQWKHKVEKSHLEEVLTIR